eukprot:2337444-Rhodomonas_salina.1
MVQLNNIGESVTDREFREHLYREVRKQKEWSNWVEMQEAKRPQPGYLELRSLGQAKWTLLHPGDLNAILGLDGAVKKEAANTISSREHIPKNCHNPY